MIVNKQSLAIVDETCRGLHKERFREGCVRRDFERTV